MSDLWFVYRQGEQLGPWTAAEVREALREGRVDPFDMVSREGSAVRIELVEVDEIFRFEQNRGAAQTTREGRAFADMAHTGANKADQAVGQDFQSSREQENAAIPERPKSKKPSRKREKNTARDAKKFYLIDRRKRQLGPLSAKEIQSLYFRGIVGNSVKVVKSGSGRQVAVAQFVSVYAGARAQRLQDVTGHTQLAITKPAEGLPSSQVMDELARIRYAVSISNFPSLSSVFMISLVIGALGYLLVSYLFLLPESPYRSEWPWHKDPATVTQSTPSTPQRGATKIKVPPQPKAKATKTAPPAVKKRVSRPPKRQSVKQPRKQPAAKISKVRRIPSPVRRQPAKVAVMPRPRQPVPAMPAIRRSPRPAIMARQAPTAMPLAQQGPTVAGSVGQVATFSGMRFNISALNSCDGKCDITFSGAAGSLTVSFFKAAHGSSLQRSGGTATITGRVARQGSGYVMYLQSSR